MASGGKPTLLWMGAVLLAGATVFFLNGLLCGVVLALYEGAGLVATVRSTLAANRRPDNGPQAVIDPHHIEGFRRFQTDRSLCRPLRFRLINEASDGGIKSVPF